VAHLFPPPAKSRPRSGRRADTCIAAIVAVPGCQFRCGTTHIEPPVMIVDRWADLDRCLHAFRSARNRVKVMRFGEC
jgi:hypothetical protein